MSHHPLRFAALLVSIVALAGCDVAGQMPPGQMEDATNPPPGHDDTPPGQDRGDY